MTANTKIVQIIAGLSVVAGFVVMIGWELDITVLTSVMPEWIRMKFSTAACFVFSGIVIYALTLIGEERRSFQRILLIIFPSLLILVMGTLFLGSVLGVQTGLENISFIDVHEINTPIFQGRPSVATMIAFILVALVGFLVNTKKGTNIPLIIVGCIVGAIGTIGVIGYLADLPILYYEIHGISNAMAVHTSTLFAFLGLAIFKIGKEQQKQNYEEKY
jgi:hypothetical protein